MGEYYRQNNWLYFCKLSKIRQKKSKEASKGQELQSYLQQWSLQKF